MNEVKQSDIQTVLDGLKSCVLQLEKEKIFSLKNFFDVMEDKFKLAGYREPIKAGDKINISVIHDAGIGDFILQSGAIRELRRIYPAAHITLVCTVPAKIMAEFCPYVDEIIINEQKYDSLKFLTGLKWNLTFAEKLLARRYDLSFGFAHNPITTALMYMSGAKQRISHLFDVGEETFVCHCDLPIRYGMQFAQYLYPMYNYGDHAVDTCFSVLEQGLHAPISNREIEVWLNGMDITFAKNILQHARRPIYALVFGGSRMIKHYPPEKYAKFLEMVASEEPTATFAILGGGASDANSVKVLKENLDEKFCAEHLIDLVDKTNYRQTAAILSLCQAYIGNDTGALHAAAAVKLPCLAVFPFPADSPPPSRVDTPRLFRPYRVPNVIVIPAHALEGCARPKNDPYCPFGCRVLDKPHCIAQITPETLLSAFKLLKKNISEENIQTAYVY